jgi:hypothetical protein
MNASRQPVEIPAEELERRFDEGEDITPYLDMGTLRVVNPEGTAPQAGD